MYLIRIALIMLLPMMGISQDNWLTIQDVEAQITFDFKSEPVKNIDTLSIGGEFVFVKSWNLPIEEEEHMNAYYAVSLSKYPLNYVHSDSSFLLIEGFLNSTVNSLLEDTTYEILTSKVDMLNGFPGKTYKFKNIETNALFKVHTYLVESLLLEMIVITKPDEWFANATDRFFSSLKINGRKENKINYGFTVIGSLTGEAEFPGVSEEQNLFIDSEYGRLNMVLKILERKGKEEGNIVFLSGETKFPDDFILKEDEKDAFFTRSIEGSLKSSNGKLLERKNIKNDNYEGVEYSSIMFDGAVHGYYTVIFKEGRLYMLGVLTLNQNIDAEAEKFFASFKIIK